MTELGCQPHWRRFTVDGLPVCSNATQIYHYSEGYQNFYWNWNRKMLIEKTECLMPCTFMEYKVCKIKSFLAAKAAL